MQSNPTESLPTRVSTPSRTTTMSSFFFFLRPHTRTYTRRDTNRRVERSRRQRQPSSQEWWWWWWQGWYGWWCPWYHIFSKKKKKEKTSLPATVLRWQWPRIHCQHAFSPPYGWHRNHLRRRCHRHLSRRCVGPPQPNDEALRSKYRWGWSIDTWLNPLITPGESVFELVTSIWCNGTGMPCRL